MSRGDNLDFLRGLSQPRLGLAILALGVAALVVATWHAAEMNHDVAARLERQQQREVVAQEAARLLKPRAATPEDLRRGEAVRELGMPWAHTLTAIEQVTDSPVYLLSLEMERRGQRLALEAEAATYEAAISYIEQLGLRPELLSPALRFHQPAMDATGRPAVRFAVDAQWGVSR